VGVLTNFLDPAVDPEVRAAVRQAVSVLADTGGQVRELEIPELEAEAIAAVMPLLLSEATHSHRTWLDARAGDYTPTVLERLQAGRTITAIAYFEAGEARERIRQRVRSHQADLDVLVLPTTPFPATPLESTTLEVGQGEQDLTSLIRMTAPFDLTGQPALSIPCGMTASGLPIGLQLVGRDFEDELVLRTGHAYQTRTEWHRLRPPVSA
jgi:aspartyl-tRNA(Asn)/glutamyl-tRNA(Gln) amidotransferase subunit A